MIRWMHILLSRCLGPAPTNILTKTNQLVVSIYTIRLSGLKQRLANHNFSVTLGGFKYLFFSFSRGKKRVHFSPGEIFKNELFFAWREIFILARLDKF